MNSFIEYFEKDLKWFLDKRENEHLQQYRPSDFNDNLYEGPDWRKYTWEEIDNLFEEFVREQINLYFKKKYARYK